VLPSLRGADHRDRAHRRRLAAGLLALLAVLGVLALLGWIERPLVTAHPPAELGLALGLRRPGVRRAWRRGRAVLAGVGRRIGHDPHALLALALVAPVAAVQVVVGLEDPRLVALLCVGFVAGQMGLGRVASLVPPTSRRGVHLARLGLALLFVMVVSHLGPTDGSAPLLALAVPVVALAAMLGGREAFVVGAAATVAYFLPIVLGSPQSSFAREREIALAASGIVIAIGSRRTVASLERALERRRIAMAADRRRARQVAGVEEVGRLLAHAGPTDDALGTVMELLVQRFGYDHVSIYLGDHEKVRLGAQRGYDVPILQFVPSVGVLGRVMRTGEAALVRDVTTDPDYAAADDRVQSLVSVPLVAAGELIGIVNVESTPPVRLDEADLATVQLVADRLASALALARDRERLAQRVLRYERLTTFARALSATLEPQALYDVITRTVADVIPCDIATLTVLDAATGEYRIVAVPGGDDRFIGARILPGEGLTGLAIQTGEVVLDEELRRDWFPRSVRAARTAEVHSSIAVPLLREGEAIGALALARTEPPRPFDEIEREILPLIASHAALALANAQLHQAAMDASIRDPFNRRHLDATMARMSAARARQEPSERRPLAVILFDLDHFGTINKQYGHAVGDDVLRTFGQLLRDRFRASDLMARYGGEEFVVLLDGATRDEASRLADEVRARLRHRSIAGPNGEGLTATVSAGCAALGPDATSLDGLLEVADVGLAMAKSAGRDQVVAA
jgi:diguanylate cyclase (GGDEF)-like protein